MRFGNIVEGKSGDHTMELNSSAFFVQTSNDELQTLLDLLSHYSVGDYSPFRLGLVLKSYYFLSNYCQKNCHHIFIVELLLLKKIFNRELHVKMTFTYINWSLFVKETTQERSG